MVSAPAPAPTRASTGLDFANWGQGHPPDTNGDVGPNYYIQTINTSIGIYDKSTGTRVAAFTFNSFMSQGNFGNLCDTDNFGDPVVLYDSFEDRWFITDFAFKLDGSGQRQPAARRSSASRSRRPATRSPAAGTSTRSRPPAASATTRSSASGRTASTCRRTCSATRPAPRSSGSHVWALNKQQMYAGDAEPAGRRLRRRPSADFTLSAGQRPAPDGHAAARARPSTSSSTEQFLNALIDLQVPRRLGQGLDLDLHRPGHASPRRPAGPTRRRRTRRRRPTRLDVLAIRAMAQTQYSNLGGAESLWVAHTVNRGEIRTRPAARPTPTTRRSAGTRRTSRAAPSRRTSSRARPSTRTARTRSSASCRASPSTAPATWRSATRSRTRPRTRRSSTPGGSPAIRSTRSARASRR